jgi:hypothetical protein
MGGTNSKSSIDALNSVAMSAVQTTTQTCVNTLNASQIIALKAAGNITTGDISQTSAVSVDFSCLFSAQKQSDIQNAMADAIAQKAEAMSAGAISSIFGHNSTEATTTLRNVFSASVNMSTIQQAVNATVSQQKIGADAGGNIIMGNITQNMSVQMVSKVIVDDAQVQAIVSKVANKVDSSASSTTTTALGGLASYIAIIVVIIIIGGIIASIASSRKPVEDASGTQDETLNESGVINLPDETTEVPSETQAIPAQ